MDIVHIIPLVVKHLLVLIAFMTRLVCANVRLLFDIIVNLPANIALFALILFEFLVQTI
jgi:hypothetical protein